MFSKGWCPYCKMAKSVLDETFGKGTWKEIDIEKGGCPPGPQIQSYMKKETGASSVSVFFAYVCSSGLNLKRRVGAGAIELGCQFRQFRLSIKRNVLCLKGLDFLGSSLAHHFFDIFCTKYDSNIHKISEFRSMKYNHIAIYTL